MLTRITILVENSVYRPDLLAQHGWSVWIEHNGHRILFDTGQSGIVQSNAAILGIDPSAADAVILSHGHYDHTGGLKTLLPNLSNVPIWIHHDALESKYSQKNDNIRYIGIADDIKDQLGEHKTSGLIRFVDGPVDIFPGITLTGPIPRDTEYETTGGAFFTDSACTCPDELLDDQALILDSDTGLIVILGCAHSGVINTLNYIRSLKPGRPIRTVIGGMHLVNADAVRISQTIAVLKEMQIPTLAPAHCTGQSAIQQLYTAFPNQCQFCSTGTAFEL